VNLPAITDREILAVRPQHNPVDPKRPYAFLVEPEHSASGKAEDVATIFLTNRGCQFRCLMCDLWKNTLREPVHVGAIPAQIDYALARLPAARHVKLYNSGNFFDHKAIPPADYEPIAQLTSGFQTVIVENHPRLCGSDVTRFRDMLSGELEIAMGLETVHPGALEALNKRMTLEDFDRAVDFLLQRNVAVRAFILLKPPGMDEAEGIEWALRSVEHAFDIGVGCCSVIPTRAGNGIMDDLQRRGLFEPPRLSSLETVFDEALRLAQGRGRVFVDLWDIEQFARCSNCVGLRKDRLQTMNLRQAVEPVVECECRH
jgi:radical SAM enzyme (TIGR01210 family)